jgi:hypothetical protein
MGGNGFHDDPPGSLCGQGTSGADSKHLRGRQISSIQVDSLKASAPLPRALEDVRKLMAEHENDVLGTEQVARTMQIILQKLPS